MNLMTIIGYWNIFVGIAAIIIAIYIMYLAGKLLYRGMVK